MVVNGRQFSLTTMFPDERSCGIGTFSVSSTGDASFYVPDTYRTEKCIAEMRFAKLEVAYLGGIVLSGIEVGIDDNGRPQKWSLKYVESK